MTKIEAEIIVALADNRFVITDAAKKLFMHRTNLYHYIRNIHKETGKDPMDFHDMCVLFPIAQRVIKENNDD